jgi:hypothetical protein
MVGLASGHSGTNQAAARVEPDSPKGSIVVARPASLRRQWLLQTLRQGYRETGRTNTLWDMQADGAFVAYADYTRASGATLASLRSALDAVLAKGCDDPMIGYMEIRYPATPQTEQEAVAAFAQAHEALEKSHYHPLLKFYAGWRTELAMNKLKVRENRDLHLGQTVADLEALARDTNAPIDEVFEAAASWLEVSSAKNWIEQFREQLDPILQQNWSNTASYFRLKGQVELARAWAERGGGWVDNVTDEGWKGFAEHLRAAEAALNRAWDLNPSNASTAYLMMQLELGQGRGRTRMETWFNRAMSFNTNFYDAVKEMSFYLEPRWYGSDKETLDFARSCVASTHWGGQVPLILATVHHSLASYYDLGRSPTYWQRPEVWPDVKSSYEKYFALNPADVSRRQDYAMDAYTCGQYAAFLEQIKLFSGGTNFAFFGGAARFQEMVRKATTEAHSSPPQK